MRVRWMLKGLGFFVLGAAFVAAVSLLVMLLWNALVPHLFGGPVVTFWEAAGLLVLSRLLFGGFRGRHGWRQRGWRGRWERMSPEERDRFRDSVRRWKDMTPQERAVFRKGYSGCWHGSSHEPVSPGRGDPGTPDGRPDPMPGS
ncbi:MAG TPA: DUF3106 domain-containing protein [Steroidobacteraceae bacterium]